MGLKEVNGGKTCHECTQRAALTELTGFNGAIARPAILSKTNISRVPAKWV
jgi:hypothetical protein